MSVQNKFKAGDKVVWNDLGYQDKFFAHTDPKQLLTVSHYGDEDDGLVFFENLLDINGDQAGVFDYRFTLVESAQESAETPSIQGKTCSQNCVSCKDKETPVLEENDENGWFKRGELPPVGTVCEAGIPHVSGVNDEVRRVLLIEGYPIAHFECGEKTYTWFSSEGGFYPPGVFEFRPIRTPEEIAKQEREAYCDRIYSVLCKAERKNNRSDMAEALYDAGLRFVEEEVE